jgi:carbon-monoxide dehydrogenase medium subunit
MRLRPFEYHEPATLDEVFDLVARHGADEVRLLAGGTALLLMIRYGIIRPGHVASLHRLDGLRGIRLDGDRLRIGALTPHADVAASPLVREHCPVLAAATAQVATPAVRNMGTIGGNLCYAESASDPAPALLSLGAAVVVGGRRGRRVIQLDGFYRGMYETSMEDGEVLLEIEVPRQASPRTATYVKWSPRSLEDKALVGIAAVATPEGPTCRELRLGLGGVNPTPVRLPAAEAMARGQRLDDDVIRAVARAAAAEVDPVSDVQGSAEYRRAMVEVWVARALRRLSSPRSTGR